MRTGATNRTMVIGLQLAILVAVIGLWELGTNMPTGPNRFLIDPFIWSRPTRIVGRVGEWLQSGIILNNVFITLYEALMSFVLGALAGVLVGFVLARSDLWSRVLNPFIQVLNALPRLVFAPIFFLLFGLDENSKIALGFSLVFFIVFFNAYQGVREVDRNVFNNVRMLGANERQMTWHVLLPSALTWILTSLHTSVGFAMVGAVVGEYLGAARGLGHVIAQSGGAATNPPSATAPAASGAASSGEAPEKAALKIGVGGQGQIIYMPLTLADQLGYFKQEGLSVEIQDLKGGADALTAMIGVLPMPRWGSTSTRSAPRRRARSSR